MAHLFCAPHWFVGVFPMNSKGEAGNELKEFLNEWGIMWCLRPDQAKE